MKMIKSSSFILFFIVFYTSLVHSQTNSTQNNNYSYLSVGYSLGRTLPANYGFPETGTQQNINLAWGKSNFNSDLAWPKHLNYPKTGLLLSYTNYGNPELVGKSISIMPFIDCNILNKWTKKLSINTGIGASYFNVIYDKVTNSSNLGVSTHFTWAFRTFLQYRIYNTEDYNFKIGVGYFHNSNGHIRLPNSGYNSFLVNVSSEFNFQKKEKPILNDSTIINSDKNKPKIYYATRMGFGQKVLSKFSDDKKDVYTFSMAIGKIKDKTYKYGCGFYYRFYEDYYDYIKNDGAIVVDKYPNYKNNPTLYASNFGVFANLEVLMSHVSLEFELGANFYKPSYKIDWQINNEKTVNEVYYPAKFDLYYNIKHIISSRLGLKYYVMNTNKSPIHNISLGATINANFGQADFGELSIGYVYSPKLF